MSIKALSDYTVYSRYSKYLQHQQRRETWQESVDRVFDMHEVKYKEQLTSPDLKELFEFAKEQVLKKRVLGAQRALQFGGEPILKHNEKLYNCSVSYVDRFEAFQEIMYLLLCGCGVGFSVQYHHINKLPKLCKQRDKKPTNIIIEDSIEGWADSIGQVIGQFLEDSPWSCKRIQFDYSQIRSEGSLIAGMFKAPGPNGLKAAHEKIVSLIESRVSEGNTTLRPIDVYDIIMHSSDAVLSGGVRRSATICVFSHNDVDMVNAKTGDWFVNNPQRGRSNNSVMLIRSETTKEDFVTLMESVKQFGEPGFVWAEDRDVLFNPCVEISMYPQTEHGESGIQFCLTGDTNVMTKKGNIPIEQLVNVEDLEVVSQFESEADDISKIGKTYINNARVTYTGVKPVYEIKTTSGPTIKATYNHQFFTTEGYKRVEELSVRDTLVRYHTDTPTYTWNRDDYVYSIHDLLGWCLGDGWTSSTMGLVFGGEEDNFALEKLLPVFTNLKQNTQTGNVYSERYNKKDITIYTDKNGVRTVAIGNKEKQKIIYEKYGITNSTAHSKTLFKYIHTETKENKAAFISGLFSADGTVNVAQKYVALTCSNPVLAYEIQEMLQEFGIVSRVNVHIRKNDKKPQCTVYIRNQVDINLFKNEIGFRLHPTKHEKLSSITYSRSPNDCRQRGLFEIISIEYVGFEPVYDITVDNSHNFVANGYVTHNCNLTEINGRKCKDVSDFLSACKASAIIGTLQAGYTDFPYLGKVSEEIVKREALLGCSITGLMDQPDILFDEKILRQGAKLIKQVNKQVAELIGINPAARTTCIKPAGSTSCILGTASGIHPHHAKRYIRRVQANKLEFPVQKFAEVNPQAVEESVWSNNNTDMVISFLCEVPPGVITKNQMSAIELLEKVKLCQQNWIEYGTNEELCVRPYLRHNVSNTITIKNSEWNDVADYIYRNRKYFTGISLLPASGDKDYPQAPFTTVYTPQEIVKEYGDASVFASGLIVDGLRAFNSNLWKACDIVLYNNQHTSTEQDDWIRRAKQFAARYFEGDERRMTYCLKDVYNWKAWVDLSRDYKEIDWSVVEESVAEFVDVTSTTAVACAGNRCEIL